MQAKAVKKYVRGSRRKIDRLAAFCRGRKLGLVKAQVGFLPQKAARELLSTLKSAEANFIFQNPDFDPDELTILKLTVDKGPTMKRLFYRAKGRADRVDKRSSHIEVVLTDEPPKKRSKKRVVAKKKAAPAKAKEASGKESSKASASVE